MKKSLFVTVMVTIGCGMLWILFFAATHRGGPVWDRDEMVQVEGGVMIDPSQPGREIVVSPFLIDKYEVTNAKYKRFRPEHTFPPQQEDFPVTNVTWEEAAAYARWAGKELPTEAEWQFAAGAAKGLRFPWGMEKRPVQIKSADELQRVGTYRDNVSFSGCFDMEGNVWEWTSDPDTFKMNVNGKSGHAIAAASPNGSIKVSLTKKILKGGWRQLKRSVTAAAVTDRMALEMEGRSPQVGFRCIRRLHPSD